MTDDDVLDDRKLSDLLKQALKGEELKQFRSVLEGLDAEERVRLAKVVLDVVGEESLTQAGKAAGDQDRKKLFAAAVGAVDAGHDAALRDLDVGVRRRLARWVVGLDAEAALAIVRDDLAANPSAELQDLALELDDILRRLRGAARETFAKSAL